MALQMIFFDMDGVIFKGKNFWFELHKKLGTLQKGKELTKKYLYTDYIKLIEEVVKKLWKGKDAKHYYDCINELGYLQGVGKVFSYIKKRGCLSAIITGGSVDAAKRVQKDFGVDYVYGNQLIIKNGKISDEFIHPVGAGYENKAKIIRELCNKLEIDVKNCVYIGDSYLDIDAFKIVGYPIAFNSSSDDLKKYAKYVVEGNNLSKVLDIIKKIESLQ